MNMNFGHIVTITEDFLSEFRAEEYPLSKDRLLESYRIRYAMTQDEFDGFFMLVESHLNVPDSVTLDDVFGTSYRSESEDERAETWCTACHGAYDCREHDHCPNPKCHRYAIQLRLPFAD